MAKADTSLREVDANSIITGWDFSTSGVKCLAFDLHGETVAEVNEANSQNRSPIRG